MCVKVMLGMSEMFKFSLILILLHVSQPFIYAI